MKLHLFLLCLLVALVTAAAIPDDASSDVVSPQVADVAYPGQSCRGDWACPSMTEYCKKGKCALRQGRCYVNKDCPKYMVCSDQVCFPSSNNGRRDFDDSTGLDSATDEEWPKQHDRRDEAETVHDIQFTPPCVNNTDCASNEVCSRGHCTLKVGRCWENRDCNRRQHCINTFCYPPFRTSRRDTGDELADISDEATPTPAPVDNSAESEVDEADDVDTADNMDVTPFDQDTLLKLSVKAEQRGNKCRRRCRYHTDCCPRDACWNQTVCLGPHR